jgi:hypothetical protein
MARAHWVKPTLVANITFGGVEPGRPAIVETRAQV